MNIVKKSGIFYELLIRGVHPDHNEHVSEGKALGGLAGAHYIEAEALVDADTGQVIQFKPGLAQDLEVDKVAGLLGAQFATFAAQLAETQKQLADSIAAGKAAADAHAAEIAGHVNAARDAAAQIAAHQNTIAELTAAHDAAIARTDAARAALG